MIRRNCTEKKERKEEERNAVCNVMNKKSTCPLSQVNHSFGEWSECAINWFSLILKNERWNVNFMKILLENFYVIKRVTEPNTRTHKQLKSHRDSTQQSINKSRGQSKKNVISFSTEEPNCNSNKSRFMLSLSLSLHTTKHIYFSSPRHIQHRKYLNREFRHEKILEKILLCFELFFGILHSFHISSCCCFLIFVSSVLVFSFFFSSISIKIKQQAAPSKKSVGTKKNIRFFLCWRISFVQLGSNSSVGFSHIPHLCWHWTEKFCVQKKKDFSIVCSINSTRFSFLLWQSVCIERSKQGGMSEESFDAAQLPSLWTL